VSFGVVSGFSRTAAPPNPARARRNAARRRVQQIQTSDLL